MTVHTTALFCHWCCGRRKEAMMVTGRHDRPMRDRKRNGGKRLIQMASWHMLAQSCKGEHAKLQSTGLKSSLNQTHSSKRAAQETSLRARTIGFFQMLVLNDAAIKTFDPTCTHAPFTFRCAASLKGANQCQCVSVDNSYQAWERGLPTGRAAVRGSCRAPSRVPCHGAG